MNINVAHQQQEVISIVTGTTGITEAELRRQTADRFGTSEAVTELISDGDLVLRGKRVFVATDDHGPITKGDLVYRVVVNLMPEGMTGPEWTVTCREVVMVRKDGAIKLQRPFTEMVVKQFSAHAIGTLFFRSPAEAIDDFATRQRHNLERAARMVDEAKRALAWAG